MLNPRAGNRTLLNFIIHFKHNFLIVTVAMAFRALFCFIHYFAPSFSIPHNVSPGSSWYYFGFGMYFISKVTIEWTGFLRVVVTKSPDSCYFYYLNYCFYFYIFLFCFCTSFYFCLSCLYWTPQSLIVILSKTRSLLSCDSQTICLGCNAQLPVSLLFWKFLAQTFCLFSCSSYTSYIC